MATEDLGRFLWVPGRLVANPTNLAAAFPFGGTQLGATLDVVVRPRQKSLALLTEEFGEQEVERLLLGESWIMTTAFRGHDDDAWSAVFGVSAAGATSGRRVAHSGARAGTQRSSSSLVLLHVADDPLRMPSVLFRRALPFLDESAAITRSLGEEGVMGALFVSIPPADGDPAASYGLLEDLVL